MQTGDTLFLTVEFPKKLVAKNSTSEIDISKFNSITGNIDILKFDVATNWLTSAKNDFLYLNIQGNIGDYSNNSNATPNPNNYSKRLTLQETADRFILKIGFVSQQQGVFLIRFSGLSASKRKFLSGCDSISFIMQTSNANNHLEDLEELLVQNLDDFSRPHSYSFEVKP